MARRSRRSAGAGGSLGDIGSHAEHLARFISGLELAQVSADLQTFVAGRRLDDNCHVLLRYTNGARGMLWSSQVAPGNENALRVRVYGSKAGLDVLARSIPNQLWFTPLGGRPQLITRGGPRCRRRGGARHPHPCRASRGLPRRLRPALPRRGRADPGALGGRAPDPLACWVPTAEDGARGMKFIEAVVESVEPTAAGSTRDCLRSCRIPMDLGIDIGTSEVKALLLDEAQCVVATARAAAADVAAATAVVGAGSARLVVGDARGARRSCARRSPPRTPPCAASACRARCTARRCSTHDDKPLRPAILWNDGRSARAVRRRSRRREPASSRAITGNIAMPGFTAPKLLWVREHEPEVFARHAPRAAAQGLRAPAA